MKLQIRVLPFSLALAGVLLLTGCRQETMPPAVGQTIRATVESEILPASIKSQKERTLAWEEMRHFYQKRQYQPAWSGVDGPGPHAGELIRAVDGVSADGLDPARYQGGSGERLAALLEAGKGDKSLASPAAQRRLADLDVELTFLYLTLAANEATGRVQPETMHIEWDSQPRHVDLDARLEKALQSKEDLAASLRSLAPPGPAFARLRDALARYRGIAEAGGWPRVAKDDTAALSARLAASGDLDVSRFQRRHGLEPTAKVDDATLAALNVPVEERIRQIELNMERWRWLPSSLGDRYIYVNVPEFRMELRDGGRRAIDMAVVVGKQQSQTPVFSDRMTYIELNPDWNVPADIAGKEIFPKLESDPGYLARHHMEVVEAAGGPRIRQLPGPDNPLGQIKFMFPNDYDVYLHDTPADHLFSRTERDFSHGCIRLERPLDLAEYLLKDDPDWRGPRIREAVATGEQKTVKLDRPIPVHIVYFTAWVEDDGTLQFRDDVYGHDARLAAALQKEPAVPLNLPALRGEVRAAR
jgi:murein L,D-transpeptidase YcbB/YkuD